MTTEQTSNAKTDIQKFEVGPEYKDAALKQIKEIVRGNNCKDEQVKLEAFEGQIVKFTAQTVLKVNTKMSRKVVPGKLSGPVKVESDQDAQNAATKAYKALFNDTDSRRKIRDSLLSRKDKGFSVDGEVVELPFWKKDFVVFQPCHGCKTTGSVKCLPCAGKGMERCPRCGGSGMGHCSHCHGAQMVQGQNNQKVQCPTCHGRGRTSCTSCNQSGVVRCKVCRSTGTTVCPNCNGNAWTSVVHSAGLEARTSFTYPREDLPQKVVQLLDEKGAEIDQDATIEIVQESVHNKPDEDEEDEQKSSPDYLEVPIKYNVTLPYGHVEYEIKGKSYYTFLFGKNNRLTHVSPFLDDLLKNGLRKLKDAAEERGDVADNLRQAAEYRTLKSVVFLAAKHSAGKAKAILRKNYPIGISEQVIQESVNYADTALKCVTKQPRLIGLGMALAFNLCVFALYVLSPLRALIVGNIGNSSLHPILDFSIVFGLAFIGVVGIQAFAQSELNSVFDKIMPDVKKGRPSAKMGQIGLWCYGGSILCFIVLLEVARHLGMGSVAWYNALF